MHSFSTRKKMLLALLMALTLLLSSCSLIVKDPAVDAAQEIIRLGDQAVTKGQIQNMAQMQLQYDAYYYYSMYGRTYDTTDPAALANAQDTVVQSMKEDLVIHSKAAELGLDQLTEEEEAKVQEDAQSDYNEALESIKTGALADSGLEGEALDQAAAERLASNGTTLDTYVNAQRDTVIAQKVRDYIYNQVEVTEEEIKAEYESKVEADKTTYAENPASYATRANSSYSTLYYAPAGVRRVKQILIGFTQEDKDAISAAQSQVTAANSKVTAAQQILDDEQVPDVEKEKATADLAAAQKELEDANAAVTAARETAFANIDEAADSVLSDLQNGADWDTLMAEKNEDPGMKSGTSAEKGYAVASGMTSFDSAFVDAAMALENVNDFTGKIRGESYGYYIIRYIGDEPEGAVPYESVKDALSSSLLSSKQTEAYRTTLTAWVDAAPFKLDLNALKN